MCFTLMQGNLLNTRLRVVVGLYLFVCPVPSRGFEATLSSLQARCFHSYSVAWPDMGIRLTTNLIRETQQ
jgi:hypothetical protein